MLYSAPVVQTVTPLIVTAHLQHGDSGDGQASQSHGALLPQQAGQLALPAPVTISATPPPDCEAAAMMPLEGITRVV
jgi:hypothetical protein